MTKTESISIAHIDQEFNVFNIYAMPYFALSLGLYQNIENPIQFASNNLGTQKDSHSNTASFEKIAQVYNFLLIYVDQLETQQIIMLPELANLYAAGLQLSDEKVATAVLTSLIAKHLAKQSGNSLCEQPHLDDAKKIVAATKAYLTQEAAIDAMVYMVSSLCKEPNNYILAASYAKKAELKRLSGATIFTSNNYSKVNRIRLLLIEAQNIAMQAEEEQLDDAYIILNVKQHLIQQGVDAKLAGAVAIVCGAGFFFEDNHSIPEAFHLEQSNGSLSKTEAIINYQANQASSIKFLQEYFKSGHSIEQAIAAANQLKEEVLSLKSIEGKLDSQGEIPKLCWEAFTTVQDYAANYYFSPTNGAFKIERNNQGNGLYTAALKAIQNALIADVDNPIHKLTPEQLSIQIRTLLPNARGLIVDQFNNIIRNDASLISVPVAFVSGLKILQQSWHNYESLSLEEKKCLQQDITIYLSDVSNYYIDFANNNPDVGGDIELNIIANYYGVQIKQHSHLVDDYKVINPNEKLIVHIFYAIHQNRYYGLAHQSLNIAAEPIPQAAYIEQASAAAEQGLTKDYLETAIALLAQSNVIIWEANNPINKELLQQTIKDASLAIAQSAKLKEKELQDKKTTANIDQSENITERYSLFIPLRLDNQLKLIPKEVELNLASIQLLAAENALSRMFKAKRNKVNFSLSQHKEVISRTSTASDRHSAALIALESARNLSKLEERNDKMIERQRAMASASLEALQVATMEAYHQWWQNIIKQQLTAIDTAYTTVDKQITQYIDALTKAYEQQLSTIDNHYDALSRNTINAYNNHQRYVAEQERNAKKKNRKKMIRTFAGMAIAAFVAPHMAGSIFTSGLGCTIATGAIAGGITSAVAGNNILQGAVIGGAFAGIGFTVDGVLGEFIQNSALLRESLSVAATASLSTAIYGGKVLDNVFASISANAVAGLIVPIPQFDANQKLTVQQTNTINNRQVMRAFTRGITTSVISKDSNLGTSLMTAGMSSLQTWIGHQANTLVQERRAMEQQANIVKSRNRLSIGDKQPAPQPAISANTEDTMGNKTQSVSKGKSGGYQINLPEIKNPCAGGLQPRMPTTDQPLSGVPSSAWQRFQENYMDTDALMYNLQSQQMSQLYDDYQVGTRIGGGIQAGFGVGQLGVAAVLAETGVGIVPACLLAARGADNLVTGGMGFVTGQDRPTMLHQAIRGVGFSDNTARWVEFGVDLSPVASGMAREAGNIAKGGMLKLYDARKSKAPVLRKPDDLLGVEPASQKLIEAVRKKGRTIDIVKQGSDDYLYMQKHGWEANAGGENLTHVLLRENPSKVALLEEFLHGTQYKSGIIKDFSAKYGGDLEAGMREAEVHVKQFMIRHQKLLNLHIEDVQKLEILLELERNQLNVMVQRRFR